MRTVAPFVPASLWLLASCAGSPAPTEGANWLDEGVLRSCLGIKVPVEMIRDQNLQKVSILLELTVLASGKIESVSIISGSGNAALDHYLESHFGSVQCAPFAAVDSPDPYTVDLELDIQIEK